MVLAGNISRLWRVLLRQDTGVSDDRLVCHHLLQRLALARRALIGMYFPPIPWPMTDTKYDKADLPAIIRDNCSHLIPLHQEKLLSLLLKYETLFDGTLGNWNRPPISIELKEGAKPYHGRPYPIAQIHKATLMKEINRLVLIGVMKRQSSSQ